MMLTLILALLQQGAASELFRDDFSKLPIGMLSEPLGQLNPAVQEYHFLAHRGPVLDPWENAIIYLDAWAAGQETDRSYLEMHLGAGNRRMEPELFTPTFVTGDVEWRDLTLEAWVKPLSFDDRAGLVFRYRTNRHHYAFTLEKGAKARLAVRQVIEKSYCRTEWKVLGETDYVHDTLTWHRLRVENRGEEIRCYIDGKLVIEVRDNQIPSGKAGLIAGSPARFADFVVSTTARPEIAAAIRRREPRKHGFRRQRGCPVCGRHGSPGRHPARVNGRG